MDIKEEVLSYRLANDSAVKRVIACEHPKFVTNKYTGERLYVACGHCKYCRDRKTMVHKSRLDAEITQHSTGCVFWTGTYDNDHLPTIKKYDCGKYWRLESRLCDGITMFIHKEADITFPVPRDIHGNLCFPNDDSVCLAYASKRDIDCFLKRLRDYIFRYMMPANVREFYRIHRSKWTSAQIIEFEKYKQLYNEKYQIRYFVTSEYGPRTWRPHFHGLFFAEDRKVLLHLPYFISKTWKLGDKKRARAKICKFGYNTSYLTTYLNSSVNYPPILNYEPFRVFQKYSRRPVLGSFKEDTKRVSAFIRLGHSEFDKHTVNKDGIISPERVLLSVSDSCGYFFKPYDYRNATVDDIKALLSKNLEDLRKQYLQAVHYKKDYLEYYFRCRMPVGARVKVSSIFENFLDNDFIRYNDYRFVRSAYKALTDFPELLTFDNYAYVAKDFYSTLELNKMALWYEEQEIASYKFEHRSALSLLRYYPLLKDWLLKNKYCTSDKFPIELFGSFNLCNFGAPDDVNEAWYELETSARELHSFFYPDGCHLEPTTLFVFDDVDSEYYSNLYEDIHAKMYARKFHKDKDLMKNV